MKFEGVCIIQESGFGFKIRIPYDSRTHECNSYHAGVPAVNPWQHCPHVHTSFSSNSVWQNYWNSSNRSAFTALSVESVILECFWCIRPHGQKAGYWRYVLPFILVKMKNSEANQRYSENTILTNLSLFRNNLPTLTVSSVCWCYWMYICSGASCRLCL